MEQSKPCTKCGQIKLFSEFNNRKASPDGKQPLCRECERSRQHKYYFENADKIIARASAWNKDNPERHNQNSKNTVLRNPAKRKESSRLSHLKHRETRNARIRQHRKENKDQARSYVLARRGRIKSTSKLVTIKEIGKLYNSPCIYCGALENIEIDHIVPLSRGGQHAIGNLAPACRSCNGSKKNKFLTEWQLNKSRAGRLRTTCP